MNRGGLFVEGLCHGSGISLEWVNAPSIFSPEEHETLRAVTQKLVALLSQYGEVVL